VTDNAAILWVEVPRPTFNIYYFHLIIFYTKTVAEEPIAGIDAVAMGNAAIPWVAAP
jgi:hypothetical protein